MAHLSTPDPNNGLRTTLSDARPALSSELVLPLAPHLKINASVPRCLFQIASRLSVQCRQPAMRWQQSREHADSSFER